MKKAAPNLSQELSIYIPSKRLPIVEQKRMLSKQLADFLHIYRKDTEQMRISLSAQLDADKKRHRTRVIDETKFQTLMYNLNESELEKLMSAYMKAVGAEASVYLGVSPSIMTPSKQTETANGYEQPTEALKSSASTSTIDSAVDERKSFYDKKLKRRVINTVRINSGASTSLKRGHEKPPISRTNTYFDSQFATAPLSRSSRSRSPSRSSVSSSTSNPQQRLSRYIFHLFFFYYKFIWN